uniref:Ig-like domain-containing protein n=1 Tax=Poecilia latipinna TaxID=48699 RepID=A0A3B3TYW5_9TELE
MLTTEYSATQEEHCCQHGVKLHCQQQQFLLETLATSVLNDLAISGRATVREGDDLNLTCSVDSFPPTVIGWSKSTKQAEHQSHNLTKVHGRHEICHQDTSTIFLFSITNVTAKDAGLYICTAKYPNYTLREEINVTVKYVRKPQISGLNQKPSVMIPPLTEGQLVTLTCTAPGLCSGSPPNITWMWRGKGENDSFIKGNITALKTENLTAFTQRHVSTLTFNSSADHHNTKITCKVSFTGNITTEETVTLNVTYSPNNVVAKTSHQVVKEGDYVTLTCSANGRPDVTFSWFKNGKQIQEGRLNFTSIKESASGSYFCKAQNKHGTNQSNTLQITVLCEYFLTYINHFFMIFLCIVNIIVACIKYDIRK